MIGKRALDALFDPPRAVRRKFATILRIEPLDRFHKANVAFINEIGQRQAKPLVIKRDLHDQAQVRVDHTLPRLVIALPDALG